MQNRYPYNSWQEILGNCDTTVFLGCTDPITAAFISERTGIASVNVTSEAKQLNSWRVSDYTPEYRRTESIGKRAVLTPDEVLRLSLDEELIILRGQKALKAQKFDFTLHPESKKLVKRKASSHIPNWKKEVTEEIDYTPAPPKQRRTRKKKEPAFPPARELSPEPYTEFASHENPEDNFMEESLEDDDFLTPIDKDSIMS